VEDDAAAAASMLRVTKTSGEYPGLRPRRNPVPRKAGQQTMGNKRRASLSITIVSSIL